MWLLFLLPSLSPPLHSPFSSLSPSLSETHCPMETAMRQRTNISNQWPVRTWGANSHICQFLKDPPQIRPLRWPYHLTSFLFYLCHTTQHGILMFSGPGSNQDPRIGSMKSQPLDPRKYTSWHLNCSLWKASGSQETQLNCTWVSDTWTLWDGKTGQVT